MSKKKTLEDITVLFIKKDYILLQPIEAVNSNATYDYICIKHQDKGVQNIKHYNLMKGRGCKYCGIEKSNKNSRKRDINKVRQEFEKCGLILLDNQEYINGKQKLKFICKSHIDKNVQEMSYEHFSTKEVKGCRYCGLDYRANAQKKNFKEIIEFTKKIDLKLLSSEEDYKNIKSKLKLECNEHGVFEMTWSNLYMRKRCPECGWELMKGENHHSWNGGITSIRKCLREILTDWKKETLIGNEFKCILTTTKSEIEVHHLYSFDLIIEDVFKELNLKLKANIGDYSNEELDLIKETTILHHGKHGLGVCLTKNLHKIFHEIYGWGNNNPSQFEEFIIRYKFGELDELLPFELKAGTVLTDRSFLF